MAYYDSNGNPLDPMDPNYGPDPSSGGDPNSAQSTGGPSAGGGTYNADGTYTPSQAWTDDQNAWINAHGAPGTSGNPLPTPNGVGGPGTFSTDTNSLTSAITAEYMKDFGRPPDANELATDTAAAQKYGLTNPNGPTGGVLGQISARMNNTPGSGQLGTPTYPHGGVAGARGAGAGVPGFGAGAGNGSNIASSWFSQYQPMSYQPFTQQLQAPQMYYGTNAGSNGGIQPRLVSSSPNEGVLPNGQQLSQLADPNPNFNPYQNAQWRQVDPNDPSQGYTNGSMWSATPNRPINPNPASIQAWNSMNPNNQIGANGQPLGNGQPQGGQPAGMVSSSPNEGIQPQRIDGPGGSNVPPGGQAYDPLKAFSAPTEQQMISGDPGYQARMDAANQALQRSAAARGNLLTGGTEKALGQAMQDYASNEYGNYFGQQQAQYNTNQNAYQQNYNNAMQQYMNAFGINQANQMNAINTNRNNILDQFGMATTNRQLSDQELMNAFGIYSNLSNTAFNQQYDLASLGLQGSAGLSGLGAQISDLLTQKGNAAAAGLVGSANVWNQGFGNAGNAIANSYYANMYAPYANQQRQ